ncbi:MAG: FAD-dependent oxidoreductase, partial [bacterium]
MNIIVIGGGLAGLTAAITMAQKDIDVTLLEAGTYCGSQRGPGEVLDTSTLVRADVLGDKLFSQAPLERPLTRRAILQPASKGVFHGVQWATDENNHSQFSVLRPKFDRWFAEQARQAGVEIITETVVQGLIQDANRVIGVHTQRGPLYGDGVFLSEGDTSQLTGKERFERLDPDESPDFYLEIQQVLPTTETFIEDTFDLENPNEGTTLDLSLHVNDFTEPLHVSLCTNEQSLTLKVIVSLEDVNDSEYSTKQILHSIKQIPPVSNCLPQKDPLVTASGLIRRNSTSRPTLADHGIAVGGSCTGQNLETPFRNRTGPSTAMGYCFGQAVIEAREDNDQLVRSVLQSNYVSSYEETQYGKHYSLEHEMNSSPETRKAFRETKSWFLNRLSFEMIPETYSREDVDFDRRSSIPYRSIFTVLKQLYKYIQPDESFSKTKFLTGNFTGFSEPELESVIPLQYISLNEDQLTTYAVGKQRETTFDIEPLSPLVQYEEPETLIRVLFSRLESTLSLTDRISWMSGMLLTGYKQEPIDTIHSINSETLNQAPDSFSPGNTISGQTSLLINVPFFSSHREKESFFHQWPNDLCPTGVFDTSITDSSHKMTLHREHCVKCGVCVHRFPAVSWTEDAN